MTSKSFLSLVSRLEARGRVFLARAIETHLTAHKGHEQVSIVQRSDEIAYRMVCGQCGTDKKIVEPV